MALETADNATCPRCKRQGIRVYTTKQGEKMCGKCLKR